MTDKLKHIFLPFVFVLFGLTAGYTLLHWFLIIQLQLFVLPEMVVNFFIPMVLAFGVMWLMLHRRLKLLHFSSVSRWDWPFFYRFMATVLVAVPLIISQEYLTQRTGRLTHLASLDEIDNLPPTKYYALDKYYIHMSGLGFSTSFRKTGKYGNKLSITQHTVFPIFPSEESVKWNRTTLLYWGVTYTKRVPFPRSEEKFEEVRRQFGEEFIIYVQNMEGKVFDYWERVAEADNDYVEALLRSPYPNPHGIVLEGRTGDFVERTGHKSTWLAGWLLAAPLVWFLMLLNPPLDKKRLKKAKPGAVKKGSTRSKSDSDDGWRITLALFVPRKSFAVTPVLVDVNVLVFLLMVLTGASFVSFDAEKLLAWGGNFRPAVVHGEWWRLLTNMFVHSGVMHVLVNVFGLFFVGMFLESRLGWKKYLSVYLVSGMVASLLSLVWHEATVSVGASGAIFGLYGVLLAFFTNRDIVKDKRLLLNVVVFVGINLLFGFVSVGVDNAAHVGGLVAGFLIGLIYRNIHAVREEP